MSAIEKRPAIVQAFLCYNFLPRCNRSHRAGTHPTGQQEAPLFNGCFAGMNMKKTKSPSPFKLSHFNDKANANAGAILWLKDPRTGEEYDHEHNLYINVLGRSSDVFEASLAKEKENRESKDYKKPETEDEKRDENVRLYSSFVVGYGQGLHDELGGAYTAERASRLLATCDSICMDVINFATNRSNFIQG